MPPLGWLTALPICVARTAAAKCKEQWRLCVHGSDSTVFGECGGMPSFAVECVDSCDVRCMTDCDWARSSHLLAQQVLEFSSSGRYLPETPNVEIHQRTHRTLWAWSLAPSTLSPPLLGGQASQTLTDSLRGSSVKIGTTQRRLAWPLRKDDTLKSGSVLNLFATFATRGCWQQLAAPKNLAEAAGGEGNKELCFNGPDRVCLKYSRRDSNPQSPH